MNRVQLRQAIIRRDDKLEPERLQFVTQQCMVGGVPLPCILDGLRLDDLECGPQREQRIDRRGVVVGTLAAATPVTRQQVEVQEPALRRGLAPLHLFHGHVTE